jgi:putative ABC transport system permease protein
VLGTTPEYFSHFRYAQERRLGFDEGQPFSDLYDAVLGAEVADALGYHLDDAIMIAHGASDVSFTRHKDKPFKVVGVLDRTGTPVDRTVHVGLEAIEAIHIDWQSGAQIRGQSISAEQARQRDLTPKAITAALVGLKSRVATFQVQRFVNDYPEEPLTAVLPGVALSELWAIMGIAENALLIVSAFVVVVGLFGMLTAILTSLDERRREMAILRSVGARPGHVFVLIMGEAAALTLAGIVLGLGVLGGLLLIAQPIVESKYGIYIAFSGLSPGEFLLLGMVLLAGVLVGMVPSYRAYKMSLADGLSTRI